MAWRWGISHCFRGGPPRSPPGGRGRYGIVAFDPEMFAEVCGLITERSTFHWFRGSFDPAQMQFELNGLWFDSPFTVYRY